MTPRPAHPPLVLDGEQVGLPLVVDRPGTYRVEWTVAAPATPRLRPAVEVSRSLGCFVDWSVAELGRVLLPDTGGGSRAAISAVIDVAQVHRAVVAKVVLGWTRMRRPVAPIGSGLFAGERDASGSGPPCPADAPRSAFALRPLPR